MDNLSLMTLLLAIATFILAGIAFWAILQNYNFRKQERKERLLNKIIEWAISISKANLELDKTILASKIHSHWIGRVSLPQLQSLFQEMHERGKYIIESANILSTPLFSIVKLAQEKTDKIIMTLDEAIITKAQREAEIPESTENEIKELIAEGVKIVKPVAADLTGIIDISELERDRQQLVDLVNKVIKEATKIKSEI